MSSDVAVMQSRPVKAEVQSPLKPEVLKPSNAANLQNITNIAANHHNHNHNNNLLLQGKLAATSPSSKGKTTTTTATATATTDAFFGRNASGRASSRVHPITPKASATKPSSSSSSRPTKSPLKPLTPIRPSPAAAKAPANGRSPTTTTTTTKATNSGLAAVMRTPKSVVRSSTFPSPFSMSNSTSPAKCRIKISYSEEEVRVPVSRRNARERNRVKQVSQGFAVLRQHVPQASRKKKLSKVETLRCAVEYIRGLQLLLDDHPPSQQPTTAHHHPTSTHHHHHHHHHHQQQQQQHHQVFQHHAIEPHVLKLPVADEAFQPHVSLRYDGLRTSPAHSEGGRSPAHSFYGDKFSPPTAAGGPPAVGVGVGVVKSEGGEEGRPYGREEQDLLEALAWWQHNIQQ